MWVSVAWLICHPLAWLNLALMLPHEQGKGVPHRSWIASCESGTPWKGGVLQAQHAG